MIRMNAHIAGYDVTFEGTANEVMMELEALKEGLADNEPVTVSKKKGPGTHDDQPDLPIDGASSASAEEEPGEASTETEDEVAGANEESGVAGVHDQKYKIEDVRRAIQGASRESKQAAKQYLIDAVGKADLNQLPTEKYAELMDVVTEGNNEAG